MLKQRLLTATVLIFFVLCIVFLFPPLFFSLALGTALLIATWEWMQLMAINTLGKQLIYCTLITLVSIVGYFFFATKMLALGVLWWCVALYLIIKHPNTPKLNNQSDLIKLTSGVLIFSPCWIGLNTIRIHPEGIAYILFALSIPWVMDTGAYFSGKAFGKHKLASNLSPGKSIEGVIGGITITLLLAGVLIFSSVLPIKKTVFVLILILVAGLISVVGDLFESLLKRQADVKDSGRILPGHGGMFDRLDSMLALIPFFALVLPLAQT